MASRYAAVTTACGYPAINAVAHIALASNDPRVYNAVLDSLQAPLQSNAMIGGMEVRTMAVAEVEKIGVASTDAADKSQGYADAAGLCQQ